MLAIARHQNKINPVHRVQPLEHEVDIVSRSHTGDWAMALPEVLQPFEDELLVILGKVFASCPQNSEDMALAKQLSLNWCIAKCKKLELTPEDYFDI
ncbi:MAG: hypothetical protein KC777_28020 [Cyanobacteria bacterium HKST-UBA02]|nr:hypothetical protein [Cyanobacteria bacterium HKST-UBA02]